MCMWGREHTQEVAEGVHIAHTRHHFQIVEGAHAHVERVVL